MTVYHCFKYFPEQYLLLKQVTAPLTQSKNKTTRQCLELYLELLKESKSCNTSMLFSYMQYYPSFLSDYDEKVRANIINNARSRVNAAILYCHPDWKSPQFFDYLCTVSLEDYIKKVEEAIDLPKEFCNDKPTT